MKQRFSIVFFIILIGICLTFISGCESSSLLKTPYIETTLVTSTLVTRVPTMQNLHQLPTTRAITSTQSLAPSIALTPTQAIPVEIIIASSKTEIGTLFLGIDGSIVNQLPLSCNLSAVPGKDYLYCLRPFQGNLGMELDRLDFKGKVLDRRRLFTGENNLFAFCFNYSVSPDGKWVTFMTGDNSYDPKLSENLDLYLLNLEQSGEKPFLVTKNHRSTIEPTTWTSSGDGFVFSDKDEKGMVQLFKMDISTLKANQVTHFDKSFHGQWIFQAKLSPDDRRIAFTTIKNNGIGVGGVVNLDDLKITWFQMPSKDYEPEMNPLWWDREGNRVVILVSGVGTNNANDTRIIWYDTKTGAPMLTFLGEGQHPVPIRHMFPLKDIDVVGLWGYDSQINEIQYWLFDTSNRNAKKINLPDLGLTPFQLIQLR